MKHEIFASATLAYRATVNNILLSGKMVRGVTDRRTIGSNFGANNRPFIEVLCSGFILSNPRNRIVDSHVRGMNIQFAVANFLWTIQGLRDADTILKYNIKGKPFVDRGDFKCALGFRMQHTNTGSQLDAVLRILKDDCSTRRAVIQFYSCDDTAEQPRDSPCALSMHFLLRDNQLHASVVMRSQSALMVMPYDIFLFTMIHELVARELNVECGEYFHYANSLHIYEDELSFARRVLEETPTDIQPMDSMPKSPLQFCTNNVALVDGAIKLKSWQDPLPAYWSKLGISHA